MEIRIKSLLKQLEKEEINLKKLREEGKTLINISYPIDLITQIKNIIK